MLRTLVNVLACIQYYQKKNEKEEKEADLSREGVLSYAVNMGREKPNFEDESLCLV
jgi:hypothetical protein